MRPFFSLSINYIQEYIFVFILLCNITNINITKKKELIWKSIFLFTIISFINSYIELHVDNYILFRILINLTECCFIYFLTKSTISNTISLLIIDYILCELLQYPIVIMFNKIFDDFSDYRVGYLGNFLTLVEFLILLFILPLRKLYERFIAKSIKIKILLLNIYIFAIVKDFIYKKHFIDYKNNLITILTCFIIVLIINFSILYEDKKMNLQTKEIEEYKRNISMLNELINHAKSNQHEYKNRIATISAMPNVYRDYESLSGALKDYLDSFTYDNKAMQPLNLNLKLVASYLFYISNEAQRDNKDLDIIINNPQINTPVNETILIDILGIMISNMLEAIDSGDTCYLLIDSSENKAHFICKNVGPELTKELLDNLFIQGYTTKTSSSNYFPARGNGLYNLRKIVKKYKGFLNVYNEFDSDSNKTYIVFDVEI